ncbi:MAG: AMP-binding protein [Candidatus Binatia bacterium]
MALTESSVPADTSVPVLDTTVGSVLRDAAGEMSDEIGLVEGSADHRSRRRWTFADLLEEAERAARALLGRFEPGDHVAVWAPNLPEWVLLQLGAGLAGIVLVPLNPAYRPRELAYALAQSEAVGLFLVPEFRGNAMADGLAEIREQVPALRSVVSFLDWSDFVTSGSPSQTLPSVTPQSPALIVYTSGTTGAPKGAVLHHRGVTNNARFVTSGLELSPGGSWLNPLPLFHVAGCVIGVLGALASRAALVQPEFFEPSRVLELCESEKITALGAVPTILIAMMEHPDFSSRDLRSLRTVGAGGAGVPAALVRRIEDALGLRFSVLFGQTEASCTITKTRLDDSAEDKAETVGLPLPQTEVRIVDTESGAVVAPGTVGEICTRGYAVMHAYYNNPEATAAAIDGDRWLHTGDLGVMDTRGYCRIAGRLKDMIIRGGENIYPREIEEVLFSHSAVSEVAVVGIPDDKWGERVAAFVRLAPGQEVSEEDLDSFVRGQLAPHKAPRDWVFVDELPTTASGKIQKFVLRDQWLAMRRAKG